LRGIARIDRDPSTHERWKARFAEQTSECGEIGRTKDLLKVWLRSGEAVRIDSLDIHVCVVSIDNSPRLRTWLRVGRDERFNQRPDIAGCALTQHIERAKTLAIRRNFVVGNPFAVHKCIEVVAWIDVLIDQIEANAPSSKVHGR